MRLILYATMYILVQLRIAYCISVADNRSFFKRAILFNNNERVYDEVLFNKVLFL